MKFQEFRKERPIIEMFVRSIEMPRGRDYDVYIWRVGTGFESRIRCCRMIGYRSLQLRFGETRFVEQCPKCCESPNVVLRSSSRLAQEMEKLPEGTLLKVRKHIGPHEPPPPFYP